MDYEETIKIVGDSLSNHEKRLAQEKLDAQKLEAKIKATKEREARELAEAEAKALRQEEAKKVEDKLDAYFKKYDTGDLSKEDFKDHILALVYRNQDFEVLNHNISIWLNRGLDRVERNIIHDANNNYNGIVNNIASWSESVKTTVNSGSTAVTSLLHTVLRKLGGFR